MRCCQLQSTVSPEDDGQMSLVLSNLKKVDIDGCITSSRICNLRNTKEAQQSLWKVGGGSKLSCDLLVLLCAGDGGLFIESKMPVLRIPDKAFQAQSQYSQHI